MVLVARRVAHPTFKAAELVVDTPRVNQPGLVAHEVVLNAGVVAETGLVAAELVVAACRVGVAALVAAEVVEAARRIAVAARCAGVLVLAAGGVAQTAEKPIEMVGESRRVALAGLHPHEVTVVTRRVGLARLVAAEVVEEARRVGRSGLVAYEVIVVAGRDGHLAGRPGLVADKEVVAGRVLAQVQPPIGPHAHPHAADAGPGAHQGVALQIDGRRGDAVAQVIGPAAGRVDKHPRGRRAAEVPKAGANTAPGRAVGLVHHQPLGRGRNTGALGGAQARHKQALVGGPDVERRLGIGREGADAHGLGTCGHGGGQQQGQPHQAGPGGVVRFHARGF